MFKWLIKEDKWVKAEQQRIVNDLLGVDGLPPDDFDKLVTSLIELKRILINKNIPEFKTKLIGFDISIKDYL